MQQGLGLKQGLDAGPGLRPNFALMQVEPNLQPLVKTKSQVDEMQLELEPQVQPQPWVQQKPKVGL